MPPVGFEPTVSADERSQTHALDRAASGTGLNLYLGTKNCHAESGKYKHVLSKSN